MPSIDISKGNVLMCQRSGMIFSADDMRTEWNGKIVYKDFWEARHPQDFIPAFIDQQLPNTVVAITDVDLELGGNIIAESGTAVVDENGNGLALEETV